MNYFDLFAQTWSPGPVGSWLSCDASVGLVCPCWLVPHLVSHPFHVCFIHLHSCPPFCSTSTLHCIHVDLFCCLSCLLMMWHGETPMLLWSWLFLACGWWLVSVSVVVTSLIGSWWVDMLSDWFRGMFIQGEPLSCGSSINCSQFSTLTVRSMILQWLGGQVFRILCY